MGASSAALSKQCPPSPTSPQVQDPTLDMATIQTGAPLYEELLRIQLIQEGEEEVEQRAWRRGGGGQSWDDRTNKLS